MLKKLIEWLKRILGIKPRIIKEYSIDEYLDIVSQYTDSEILKEINKGKYYTGGDCNVSYKSDGKIHFEIRMFFIDKKQKRYVKEAYRILKPENFDKNTRESLKLVSKTYEINLPKKGNEKE